MIEPRPADSIRGSGYTPQTKPEYMAAIFIYFCPNRVKAIAVPGASIYGYAKLFDNLVSNCNNK